MEFTDSAVSQNYSLNCYHFPSPTAVLFVSTSSFPIINSLRQHFTSKDKAAELVHSFNFPAPQYVKISSVSVDSEILKWMNSVGQIFKIQFGSKDK